jgi:hypothetical protein
MNIASTIISTEAAKQTDNIRPVISSGQKNAAAAETTMNKHLDHWIISTFSEFVAVRVNIVKQTRNHITALGKHMLLLPTH